MTLEFDIPGVFPAWRVQNWYRMGHWTKRHAVARDAHEQVWAAVMERCGVGLEPFPGPVVVTTTQYCVRPPDPDNSVSKVIIDGLRYAGVLRDDTPDEVVEVRARSRKVGRAEEERIHVCVSEQERQP